MSHAYSALERCCHMSLVCLQYEAYMLSQAVLTLEHVEEVTSTEYLRTQLVQALMTYLHLAFELFKKDAEIRRETNEASIKISFMFCFIVVDRLQSLHVLHAV